MVVIPQDLRDKLRAGKVIPFVGAGVSMAVKRQGNDRPLFPSRRGFLEKAAARLAEAGRSDDADLVHTLLKADPPGYPHAALRARDQLKEIWIELLREEFDPPASAAAEECLTLARACWKLGRKQLILTTNYDRVLAWSCPEVDRDIWDVEPPAGYDQLMPAGLAKPTIWHLHGQIGNPAELILVPDGHQRLYPPVGDRETTYQRARAALNNLLASHTLLFVGFGLADAPFSVELSGLTAVLASGGPHYVLVPEQEAETLRAQDLPVEMITYYGHEASLLQAVEELGDAAQPAPAAGSGGEGTILSEDEWSQLISSIRERGCIPILGPEIPAEGPDGNLGPITDRLARELLKDIRDFSLPLDPPKLPHVSQVYAHRFGEKTLVKEVIRFYERSQDHYGELHARLAAMDFELIISLSHDLSLVKALEDEGKRPVVKSYNFRGSQERVVGFKDDEEHEEEGDPASQPVGSPEEPLVYYLHGDVDNPESLVLTDMDVIRFFSAVMSKSPGLPVDVLNQLRQTDVLLLLGCGLTRWYLRLLAYVLQVTQPETRSFLLEQKPPPSAVDLDEIKSFLEDQRARSYEVELNEFARELWARWQSVATTQPEPPIINSRAAAPSVFICHASEDKDHAQKIYNWLESEGFHPWLDKEKLRGGDQWSAIIKKMIKDDEDIDYLVVIQSENLVKKVVGYVNVEIRLAIERQEMIRPDSGIHFIIPVRIDDSKALPALNELQMTSLIDEEAGLKKLAKTIREDQERKKRWGL